jgi:hypothetical protein
MASQMADLTSSHLPFVFICAGRVPETELHAPGTSTIAVLSSLVAFIVAYLLPINLLEDFSKPLSLESEHFRLLGNIMADELTIAVLSSLVAFIVPVAVM